jgi:hypothetical protein
MELPKKGEVVPLPRIEEICRFNGLDELWEKIHSDPPGKPFASDGCTLMLEIAELTGDLRLGGHERLKQSFSWGFGRR